MKNILILLVLAIMAASCVTQSRCDRKYPPEQSTVINDSIVITEQTRYYDTIITKFLEIPRYTVKDSTVLRYKDGIISVPKPLRMVGHYSVALVWVDNNVLKGNLTEQGWIRLTTTIAMQEKTIKELRAKDSTKIIIKEVYKTKGIVKLLAWIGGLCMLVSVFILLVKFIKPKWL